MVLREERGKKKEQNRSSARKVERKKGKRGKQEGGRIRKSEEVRKEEENDEEKATDLSLRTVTRNIVKCEPVRLRPLFFFIISNTRFIWAFTLSTFTLEKPCCASYLNT